MKGSTSSSSPWPAEAVPMVGDPRCEEVIPGLEGELVLLAKAIRGTSLQDEGLIPVVGNRVAVLNSYREAGWRYAVDEQRLRGDVLARVVRAAATLPTGFGLAVFDAWRPLGLQQELFDAVSAGDAAVREWTMVAPPSSDPATPPPHLTGGTVDLTLTWDGRPLALGTDFDDLTNLAELKAFEQIPGPVRALRRLLFHALRGQGFVGLEEEWWHFEYGTRLWSGVTGNPVLYGPASA